MSERYQRPSARDLARPSASARCPRIVSIVAKPDVAVRSSCGRHRSKRPTTPTRRHRHCVARKICSEAPRSASDDSSSYEVRINQKRRATPRRAARQFSAPILLHSVASCRAGACLPPLNCAPTRYFAVRRLTAPRCASSVQP